MFLKKGYLIFSYYLILPNVFCLCVWDVLVCVSLIYTIFISVPCVSWKDLNLTESNQQVCDFYKWAVFLNQGHCGTLQRKFLISANYSFIVIQTAAVSTLQVVLIYIYMSESGYWVLLVPHGFVCVCLISNRSTSKKPCHLCQTLVSLTPCYIKHTTERGRQNLKNRR